MKKSFIAAAALAVVTLSLASPAVAQDQPPQVTAECEMQQTIEEMNQSQGDQPFMTCNYTMEQQQQQGQQGQQGGNGGGGLLG